MFRLTKKEWLSMRSQNATALKGSKPSSGNDGQNNTVSTRNKIAIPYAFTEHGVTMLASVLKSAVAVKMSIAVVRAFIELKRLILKLEKLSDELDKLKQHLSEHDNQLNQLYEVLENLLNEKKKQLSWSERKRIGFK